MLDKTSNVAMKDKSVNRKLKKALIQLATANESGNEKLKEKANQTIREEGVKENKGLHRALLIQMGLYGIHKEKTYASKKSYKRKGKHLKSGDE